MTELQEIAARLDRIEALLTGSVAPAPRLESLLTVEQFAAAVGRGTLWVYRGIKARQIAVTKAGKPYQIPSDQVAKFRRTRATV